jgi:hypothetical protein
MVWSANLAWPIGPLQRATHAGSLGLRLLARPEFGPAAALHSDGRACPRQPSRRRCAGHSKIAARRHRGQGLQQPEGASRSRIKGPCRSFPIAATLPKKSIVPSAFTNDGTRMRISSAASRIGARCDRARAAKGGCSEIRKLSGRRLLVSAYPSRMLTFTLILGQLGNVG